MKNWWRTDDKLMKNWWRGDEELMKGWWRTDEELVKKRWRTDDKLMKKLWRNDEELMKKWWRTGSGLVQTATDCHWLPLADWLYSIDHSELSPGFFEAKGEVIRKLWKGPTSRAPLAVLTIQKTGVGMAFWCFYFSQGLFRHYLGCPWKVRTRLQSLWSWEKFNLIPDIGGYFPRHVGSRLHGKRKCKVKFNSRMFCIDWKI